MNTPLMELIEWAKKAPYVIERTYLITKATELLEKEREVICNAYWDGGQDIPCAASSCDNYYTKTFTNESK